MYLVQNEIMKLIVMEYQEYFPLIIVLIICSKLNLCIDLDLCQECRTGQLLVVTTQWSAKHRSGQVSSENVSRGTQYRTDRNVTTIISPVIITIPIPRDLPGRLQSVLQCRWKLLQCSGGADPQDIWSESSRGRDPGRRTNLDFF